MEGRIIDEKLRLWQEVWNELEDTDDYVTCSYCGVPFKMDDDWDLRCYDEECEKLWCSKCSLSDLVECTQCEHNACGNHLEGDGRCIECVANDDEPSA